MRPSQYTSTVSTVRHARVKKYLISINALIFSFWGSLCSWLWSFTGNCLFAVRLVQENVHNQCFIVSSHFDLIFLTIKYIYEMSQPLSVCLHTWAQPAWIVVGTYCLFTEAEMGHFTYSRNLPTLNLKKMNSEVMMTEIWVHMRYQNKAGNGDQNTKLFSFRSDLTEK